MKLKSFFSICASAALLAAGTVHLRAQSLEPFNPYGIFSPSVEAWQMTRYGNLTPSLYTGAMTFSLPLYTYEDPDFTIPISLEYSFDGYRPGQHSGTVGYGWYLNCGGAITREVRGMPDEGIFVQMGSYLFPVRGWLAASKLGLTQNQQVAYYTYGATRRIADVLESDEIMPAMQSHNVFSDIPMYREGSNGSHLNDMAPDLWHFNFLGHSGDFIIQNNGDVRIFNSDLPHGSTTVTFSSYDTTPDLTVITICTGDGYRYEFHVDGISNILNGSTGEAQEPTKAVTSWRLARIAAPNGRYASFSLGKTYATTVVPRYDAAIWGRSEKYYGIGNLDLEDFSTYPEVRYSVIREEIGSLSSLTIHNSDESCQGEVSFVGEDEDYPQYSEYANSCFEWEDFYLFGGAMSSGNLRQMIVRNADGDMVDAFLFNYNYHNSGVPKAFLASVVGRRFRKYSFSYDLSGYTLPCNDTQGTDHWGYWNGNTFSDLREHLRNASTGLQSLHLYDQMVDGVKEPSYYYAKCGALTSISYPTGGSTLITYEPNIARRRLNAYTNSGYVVLENVNNSDSTAVMPAGGVRVHTLTDIDNEGNTFVTEMCYENPSDLSSGILMQMPKYADHADYQHSETIVNNLFYCNATVHSTCYGNACGFQLSNDSHVVYSDVRVLHPDGSSTSYKYSSVADGDGFTDTRAAGVSLSKHVISSTDQIQPIAGAQTFRTYEVTVDRRFLRGKALLELTCDSNGVETKRVENTYGHDIVNIPELCVNSPYYFIITNYSALAPVLLSRCETLHGVRNTISYEYNSLGQIIGEEQSSGPAGLQETNKLWYHYLHELQDSSWFASNPALRDVKDAAVRTRTTQDGNRFITGAENYTYFSTGNPKPASISTFDIPSPVAIPATGGRDALFATSLSGQPRIRSFLYDTLFRLTDITLPGNATIHYTWDGKNLVAKSIGNVGSPESAVSIYEWKDMVGPVMISYPTGSRMLYGYDQCFRIRSISDNKHNPIQTFSYNLVNDH